MEALRMGRENALPADESETMSTDEERDLGDECGADMSEDDSTS
jgi:hypothetical protein